MPAVSVAGRCCDIGSVITIYKADPGNIHMMIITECGHQSGHIGKKWLPTLDNLRNFLLTTTTEVLSFFHQLREAP
jgi:hypothetical protein